MNELHILVTGVGRRVELLQAFRQAALNLDINLKIYGADMTGTAPALAYCDEMRSVCAMKNPNYINELLKICKKDRIDLVMPTIDTDLLILAKHKKEFEEIGVKVLISAEDKVRICRDKNHTGDFFVSCGLKAPLTYNDVNEYPGPYPCFIKPKDGSSSINAYKVQDYKELLLYSEQVTDYIIQPFISGREFTIDIFCDFDGNPIYITPRQRLQVRAGEVLKTKISMDETMIEEAKKICSLFQPCGPITVQLIQDEESGDNYYIEINPRYGGGAPLSMKAGARSAEAVLRLLLGEHLQYTAHACDGAVYSRFDQSVCIDAGRDAQPIKGIIFDLDDTLYSESDYVRSGYQKIGMYLGRADAAQHLWNYFCDKKPAIDAYLSEIDMPEQKENCLQIYREQMPDISLYPGVEDMLVSVRSKGIYIGVITDGRPEGQHQKLKALGLENLVDDIIITDELGGPQFRKPCDIAFRIMQLRWKIPYEQMLYVGDNPTKDFQACRQLGMQCVYFNNREGLYSGGKTFGIQVIEQISELDTLIITED